MTVYNALTSFFFHFKDTMLMWILNFAAPILTDTKKYDRIFLIVHELSLTWIGEGEQGPTLSQGEY